jgi:preprotein translocase subunit SecA
MAKMHIGKKVKEVWRASRMKGTEFAAAINKDRQVIYDIFKRETIDTGLLQKIGKVLDHDFFNYYSAAAPLTAQEEKVAYGLKVEIQKLEEELKLTKKQLAESEKKAELLEKVNKLLEEKLEGKKKSKKK